MITWCRVTKDNDNSVVFAADYFASAMPGRDSKVGKTCVVLKNGQAFFTNWTGDQVYTEIQNCIKEAVKTDN